MSIQFPQIQLQFAIGTQFRNSNSALGPIPQYQFPHWGPNINDWVPIRKPSFYCATQCTLTLLNVWFNWQLLQISNSGNSGIGNSGAIRAIPISRVTPY